MSEVPSAEKDAASMRLRGDGINVNRYRVSRDDGDKRVHLYLDVRGQHTVADLLAAITEQGADPQDVTFRGGCFVITALATDEDREAWRRGDEAREARAVESRRQQYERLRAEFETDVLPPGVGA